MKSSMRYCKPCNKTLKHTIIEEDIKWILDYCWQNPYYKNPFIPIFGNDEDDTTTIENIASHLPSPIVENTKYLFDNLLSHLSENLFESEELDLKVSINLSSRFVVPHTSAVTVSMANPPDQMQQDMHHWYFLET